MPSASLGSINAPTDIDLSTSFPGPSAATTFLADTTSYEEECSNSSWLEEFAKPTLLTRLKRR